MMMMMMMTMVMLQAAGSWDTDTRRSGGSSGPSRDTSVREGLVRCGGNDQEAAKGRLEVSTEFCGTQYLEKGAYLRSLLDEGTFTFNDSVSKRKYNTLSMQRMCWKPLPLNLVKITAKCR